MSLKSKLEAVIYAAEEPVTLTQLAALFANEAFEWKAEQEAAARAVEAETVAPQTESLPMLTGDAEPLQLGPETAGASVAAPTSEAALEVKPDDAPAPESAETAPPTPEAQEPPSDASAAALDAETETRRLARQRDREVRAILRQVLNELTTAYAKDDRGIEIREIAGGYRMATKPEYHDAVRLFIKSLKPPLKLSLPALETLAVIAYKQPVTAPEVSEIRGVESGGVLGSLLSRKLIATAGRKQVIGRPILYKTTKEFLLRFGLKDLSELPSMEEFEKIAASELGESGTEESATEEVAESTVGAPPAGVPDLDENAAEDDSATSKTEPEAPATEAETKAAEESAEVLQSVAESADPMPAAQAIEEVAPAEPSQPEEQAEVETPHHG